MGLFGLGGHIYGHSGAEEEEEEEEMGGGSSSASVEVSQVQAGHNRVRLLQLFQSSSAFLQFLKGRPSCVRATSR